MRGLLSKRSSRRGFALIVVAFLISVMLLIGAAMVSLMQVESAATQYEMRLRMARDNARYAMDIAIGELQKHAGKDQVVTALADVYRTTSDENFKEETDPATTGVYQPFWTGVWRTDISGVPEWLVTKPVVSDFNTGSGDEADPTAPPYSDSIRLVGSGSATLAATSKQADFHVTVPLEIIQSDKVSGLSGTATTIGKYGYWVGDLGVKASFALDRNLAAVDHEEYSDPDLGQTQRLEQMVVENAAFGLGLDPNWSLLGTLASEFQLREGLVDFGLSSSEIRRNFHDATLVTRSVIADTGISGLKEDLSNIHVTGNTEIDNYLVPYMNAKDSIASSPTAYQRVYNVTPSDPANGQFGIYPTVTGFAIDFKFKVDRLDGNKLLVQPYIGIEIWNPYTSALAVGDLILNIKDLPTMEIKYTSGTVETTLSPIDLNSLLGGTDFMIDMPDIEPGRVVRFSGGKNGLLEDGGIADEDLRGEYVVAGYEFVDDTPLIVDDDFITILSVTEASPGFELRMSNVDKDLLLESQYFNPGVKWFDEITAGDIAAFPIDSGDALYPTAFFGYFWDLQDPTPANNIASRWGSFDPRTGPYKKIMMEGSGLNAFDSDPTTIANNTFDFDKIVTLLDDGLLSDNTDLEDLAYDVAMFELPRQELISISGFTDAVFSSNKRWVVGDDTPVGSVNYLFDQYYFSTVPQVDGGDASLHWQAGDPLPNRRLELFGNPSKADLRTEYSSQHFMLKGSFNINSTSIDAWAAVLRGINLLSWDNADVADDHNPETFGAADYQFFRFSQTAEEMWDGPWRAGGPLDRERQSFQKGITSLNAIQIEALATEIVSKIRDRMVNPLDQPFLSVREFLDEGILNEAIAEVDSLAIRINPTDINSYAPGYFDQRSIMNALGPFMVARSDTFLIRSYGAAVNPFDETEVFAGAYCEAVVQRIPTKHATDDDNADPVSATSTGTGDFGRQFKVIAFRWLSEDEI